MEDELRLRVELLHTKLENVVRNLGLLVGVKFKHRCGTPATPCCQYERGFRRHWRQQPYPRRCKRGVCSAPCAFVPCQTPCALPACGPQPCPAAIDGESVITPSKRRTPQPTHTPTYQRPPSESLVQDEGERRWHLLHHLIVHRLRGHVLPALFVKVRGRKVNEVRLRQRTKSGVQHHASALRLLDTHLEIHEIQPVEAGGCHVSKHGGLHPGATHRHSTARTKSRGRSGGSPSTGETQTGCAPAASLGPTRACSASQRRSTASTSPAGAPRSRNQWEGWPMPRGCQGKGVSEAGPGAVSNQAQRT